MRVVVLHSDVSPDAPPDEQDTLITARAIADALLNRGHRVGLSAFSPDPAHLTSALRDFGAEVVFNLVESVFGHGDLAGIAAAMLSRLGIPFTGASSAALSCAADKCFAKRVLRSAGLPTPDWCEPPSWSGLSRDITYVVKWIDEDASVGLDDGAVVRGEAVHSRAAACAERHGGRWFAEAYCPGREFNVSVLSDKGAPRVMPIAETEFRGWPHDRPRIVGYAAKWHSESPDCIGTPRAFGIERELPGLAHTLSELACSAWRVMDIREYARVDFRLDACGAPMILELNPNPCLEPHAGFAAAAAEAGIAYSDLVERIVVEAAEKARLR
jgi:D-alanine-D-alanine ligase